MADINETILRKLSDIEMRIRRLEHHEFAFMHSGDGVPGYTAAEGTLYWDWTNDVLHVNSDGGNSWVEIANA